MPLRLDRQGWALHQNSLGPAEAIATVPQDMGEHPLHPDIGAMHMCHTCAQTPYTQDTAHDQQEVWDPEL